MPSPLPSSFTKIFRKCSIYFYEICTARYIRIVFFKLHPEMSTLSW